MKKEITYSIIIPHKNIPKLLQRCLDSIPQRDDTEIIIVDDNSDPNIVDFNNFPGKDRKNTTVILDKKGGGAGHARNLGLEVASGKKLLFADADDYFNYCIRDVLEEYKEDDTDIVFFNMSSVDSEYYTNSKRADYLETLFQKSKQKLTEAIFKLRYCWGSPCAKIIKRSLVKNNQILFDTTSINNDVKFSYLTGFYAKSCKIDDRALYCATSREGSITSKLNRQKVIDRIEVFCKRDRFFRNNGIQYKNFDQHIQLMYHLKKTDIALFNESLAIFDRNGFDKIFVYSRLKSYSRALKKIKIREFLGGIIKK